MKNKVKVAGLPGAFHRLDISASEDNKDERILFYIGADALHDRASVEFVLISSEHIQKLIVCDKEHLSAIRAIGIDAYDIKTIENIENRTVLKIGNVPTSNNVFPEDMLKKYCELKKHIYHINDYHEQLSKRSSSIIHDEGYYPGMAKKKGGFRHKFMRNSK
ncbi:hypothetical protein LMH73_002665 [Vibrio splendidus]|nr:hypothetical protein [Vibrio splendidus]MCC4880474.1 hypothetical protein [Vibrio splendidus]